ncbi:Ubiquitin-associated domain-containing protein 2 [Fasciola gigantica]|uniref:Ubiquitin-associated domain-containing protein 2 n=1 Tax=Fasciola gigantica TaxID=46835 RepID=A0A504YS43_FASGI|nr:Ubiquitin-associated domain-containing protein 2 [Fasciola gigantica]
MIAPQSHSGFYKTTITKCFLAFCVIFSLVLRMPFAKQRDFFTYNLDDIFENGSLWRLVFCKLAFLNTKDLVCGGLLLYYFRIFERRYGPRKFLSYLFYCATVATLCELTVASILRRMHFEFHTLPSGPYSMIFPFFIPYFLDIPWVPVAHVVGIPITGKSFPYLFGIQMATTSPETMLVCTCALLTGLLYEKDLLHVQSRWLFPERLIHFGSEFIGPVLETPPPAHINKPLGATLELQEQVEWDRRELQQIEARRAAMQNRMASPLRFQI